MEELLNAAKNGDVTAQEKVGTAYLKGTSGLEKNIEEAFKYFKLAADNNSPMANYQLGKMYEKGNGVESNINEAKKYYQKASDMGYVNATNSLKQLENKEEVKSSVVNPGMGAAYKAPEAKKIDTFEKNSNSKSGGVSKSVAMWLALILGSLGIHEFYLGKKEKGVIRILVTLCLEGFGIMPLTFIWNIIDAVRISKGKVKNNKGERLV